ncbi:MAG TPA: NADH-quinone oxidoreductase subunit J [Thermoanaerobaculia bacterium]|jgi:NADH-quinone oxidoreductase subunit J|nr:NADH-quinone oxidoreductase subunit J [Thermoanaerobaculia bacterium]
MDAVTSQLPLLVFLVVGSIAVGSAILVVAMRNPVHSALFLLLTFLCVAVLFVLKAAEFVAAVQVLVYAGGIMVLFLFVVMLINYRHLPEERVTSPVWLGGIGVGLALFVLFVAIVRPGVYHDEMPNAAVKLGTVKELRPHPTDENKLVRTTVENRNAEAVAMALYTDYLVPFEVASLFLLVAMIGAIVIGKRELSAEEEEATPQFILERAEVEKEVKEAMSA